MDDEEAGEEERSGCSETGARDKLQSASASHGSAPTSGGPRALRLLQTRQEHRRTMHGKSLVDTEVEAGGGARRGGGGGSGEESSRGGGSGEEEEVEEELVSRSARGGLGS